MGGFASGHCKLTVIPTRTTIPKKHWFVCVCVCVSVCICACVCVCVCMYSIIHGPLLGICAIVILHVDLPLCKRDFTGPTFVSPAGTLFLLFPKDKDQGPGITKDGNK